MLRAKLETRRIRLLAWAAAVGGAGWLAGGCATSNPPAASGAWPRIVLRAERAVRLTPPRGIPFGASGLLSLGPDRFAVVNDRGFPLWQCHLAPRAREAELLPWEPESAALQRALSAGNRGMDLEGVARDASGKIYLCEESRRAVIRLDPVTGRSEAMAIDWSSVEKYFNPANANDSWEGIAAGDNRLYLANERKEPRIVVVDLATQKVVDHFAVAPRQVRMERVAYSDLAWASGRLFVLVRSQRCILEVDPGSHRIEAEFDFAEVELSEPYVYSWLEGTMEGLVIAGDWIWLVTDNNGLGRLRAPWDARPTLFQCRRPASNPTPRP